MQSGRVIVVSLLAGASFVAGMGAEHALRSDQRFEHVASRVAALEVRNRALAADLEEARAGEARDALAPTTLLSPVREAAWAAGGGRETAPRDATTIRSQLLAALSAGDGDRVLDLLAELARLGDAHYPELAGHWIRLVDLDARALDALGLSEIELASALAAEPGLMGYALGAAKLDPVFRKFTADTLERASVAVRAGILAALEFSNERDKRVLSSLLRAVEDVKDAGYVDRFEHLVRRTDLYNDTRGRIAFMMAEIPGDASRRAIDELYVLGGYDRWLPVLESLHSPPATGLLITNAMKATPDRIGLYDVLLEYNGRRILSKADLTIADGLTSPGDVVEAKVYRQGAMELLNILVTDTAPGHLHFDVHPIVAH